MFGNVVQMAIDDFGEDVEIRRKGCEVALLKALFRGNKNPYCNFLPDADVQEGDEIFFVKRQKKLTVASVEREVIKDEVISLRVYDTESRTPSRQHTVVNNNGIIANSITHSAIQQHSPHATQTLSISTDQRDRVKDALRVVLEALNDLDLEQADKEEVQADAKSADAQLDSPKTKWAVVKSFLTGICEKVKTGLTEKVAAPIVSRVQDAVQAITDIIKSWKEMQSS